MRHAKLFFPCITMASQTLKTSPTLGSEICTNLIDKHRGRKEGATPSITMDIAPFPVG